MRVLCRVCVDVVYFCFMNYDRICVWFVGAGALTEKKKHTFFVAYLIVHFLLLFLFLLLFADFIFTELNVLIRKMTR